MRPQLRSLWQCVLSPELGFKALAAQAPTLGEAVKGMLLVRTPPAFLALLLSYLGFTAFYGRLARLEGPIFDYLWANLPDSVNPADVRAAFQALPPAPSWLQALPWLLALAPLGILSLWFHDAVWDHTCLWMLRGLKAKKSFKVTLVAEAGALQVGSLGAVLGLLGELPVVGWVLKLVLFPVAIYFWLLRGYALSVWHGCPVWKGVVATLLHALLMLVFLLLTLGAFLVLVLEAVRS